MNYTDTKDMFHNESCDMGNLLTFSTLRTVLQKATFCIVKDDLLDCKTWYFARQKTVKRMSDCRQWRCQRTVMNIFTDINGHGKWHIRNRCKPDAETVKAARTDDGRKR